MDNLVGWIGLGTAIFVHLVGTVVWATRMTTVLEMVQQTLGELHTDHKAMTKVYITKEEFAKDIGRFEKEQAAIWKHIDDLRILRNETASELKRQHDKDHT